MLASRSRSSAAVRTRTAPGTSGGSGRDRGGAGSEGGAGGEGGEGGSGGADGGAGGGDGELQSHWTPASSQRTYSPPQERPGLVKPGELGELHAPWNQCAQ